MFYVGFTTIFNKYRVAWQLKTNYCVLDPLLLLIWPLAFDWTPLKFDIQNRSRFGFWGVTARKFHVRLRTVTLRVEVPVWHGLRSRSWSFSVAYIISWSSLMVLMPFTVGNIILILMTDHDNLYAGDLFSLVWPKWRYSLSRLRHLGLLFDEKTRFEFGGLFLIA